MSLRLTLATLLMLSLVATAPAAAQRERCQVPPFSGASSPEGAKAAMRVVNDGAPCSLRLYGVPAERRNPATEGTITRPAKRGKAEFVDGRLQYTPEPGFVGADAFSAQAHAIGESRTRHLLQVHVTVEVVAR